MILADTSVWIDKFRNLQTAGVRRLSDPNNLQFLIVGDLIMTEILQGASSDKQAASYEYVLRTFPVVQLLDDQLAVKAAKHYRTMRSNGVTLRKVADLIIGTYCIEHRHYLLHNDRDYDAMEAHCGLRVMH
jgi:predicted nucleic acid-binding protein